MSLYLANMAIMLKISQLDEEKVHLQRKLSQHKAERLSKNKSDENHDDDSNNSDNDSANSENMSAGRRRKKRRRKEEIERDFVCTFKDCGKSYGYEVFDNRSENSLNQHIKIKHPEHWEEVKDSKGQ